MTSQEFVDRLTSLIESAEAKFLKGINADQDKLIARLEKATRELNLSGENIEQSTANLKALRNIDDLLKEVLSEGNYQKRVEEFIENYDTLGQIVNEYLSDVSAEFVPSKRIFETLKQNAINLAQESLLGAGLDSQLIQPIQKILNDNITSGGNFYDMRKQVSEFIGGNKETLGRLESYAGQITRDALNQFSQSYQTGVTKDLGLDWFLYRGGTVKDTRPFCRERHGKYYHRSEIEGWAKLNWAGKIPGTTATTIFVYRGGFSCLHYIVAVDERVVPKADLARINKS